MNQRMDSRVAGDTICMVTSDMCGVKSWMVWKFSALDYVWPVQRGGPMHCVVLVGGAVAACHRRSGFPLQSLRLWHG